MDKLTPLVVKISGTEKYQRLLSPQAQTCALKSGFVNLKPGEEIGEHSTEEREEVIVVLNGRGVVYYSEGSCLDIEADCVVYMPPNTKHNVKNTGSELLSYIFVVVLVK